MPKYVAVDSQNNWLEFGEYSSPEEAIQGAIQSSDFDDPSTIYVYEVVNEVQFARADRKGSATYRRL